VASSAIEYQHTTISNIFLRHWSWQILGNQLKWVLGCVLASFQTVYWLGQAKERLWSMLLDVERAQTNNQVSHVFEIYLLKLKYYQVIVIMSHRVHILLAIISRYMTSMW